eukprot:971371-Alexandrium_andersonii.AAC.1
MLHKSSAGVPVSKPPEPSSGTAASVPKRWAWGAATLPNTGQRAPQEDEQESAEQGSGAGVSAAQPGSQGHAPEGLRCACAVEVVWPCRACAVVRGAAALPSDTNHLHHLERDTSD